MADFYTDHNVAFEIAFRLRSSSHTARTAYDIGLHRAEDDEHLRTAAEHAWILVTHNAKDFFLLHGAWRRWSKAWQVSVEHAGILVLPQLLPATLVDQELSSFLRSGLPVTTQLYTWRVRG